MRAVEPSSKALQFPSKIDNVSSYTYRLDDDGDDYELRWRETP